MSRPDAGSGVLGAARDALTRMSRRRRLFIAALLALMVGLPVILTLVREDSYTSSIPLYVRATPVAKGGPSQEKLLSSVRGLIPSPRVATAAAFQVDYPLDRQTVLDNSRVVSAGPSDIELRVDSGTPDRARELANREARLIQDLGTRQRRLQVNARPQLARLLKDAGDASVPTAQRNRSQLRLQIVLGRLGDLIKLHEHASQPEISGTVDRLVDRLPGSFPPNPGPFPAALAGMALALALLALWLLVLPLREARPSS